MLISTIPALAQEDSFDPVQGHQAEGFKWPKVLHAEGCLGFFGPSWKKHGWVLKKGWVRVCPTHVIFSAFLATPYHRPYKGASKMQVMQAILNQSYHHCQDDMSNVLDIANGLGWASLWGKPAGHDAGLAAPDYTASKWPIGINVARWVGLDKPVVPEPTEVCQLFYSLGGSIGQVGALLCLAQHHHQGTMVKSMSSPKASWEAWPWGQQGHHAVLHSGTGRTWWCWVVHRMGCYLSGLAKG